MSGHSKWATIKHKKGALDAKRGKLFTKLIKEITVAARMGGGDPAGNARLRAAVDAAKEANMPAENIARAVRKGTGELEGASYEEVAYEGYGPGGVAMIVACLTDNRNRTAGDVRTTFAKGGGHLAAEGAVAWIFEKRGTIEVPPGPGEDEVVEAALEAGAEDVVVHGAEGFEVRTHANELHAVAVRLERRLKLGESRVAFVPKTAVRVDDPEKARALLRLMEALEELDDVQGVHANFDMDDALLDEVAPQCPD